MLVDPVFGTSTKMHLCLCDITIQQWRIGLTTIVGQALRLPMLIAVWQL
jgi:hypothetical protein